MRTIFPEENDDSVPSDTAPTQEVPESTTEPETKVTFPKALKHRGNIFAKIYRPTKSYPMYRLAWTVAGKRQLKAFRRYSDAKRHGDELVKELAKGSHATLLTAGQARDALAAFERLESFYQETGRRVSLLGAAAEFCESSAKLNGHTLGQAVNGYLNTVASVKKVGVAQAVEEFIAAEESRTTASGDQRPQLSSKYAYNRAIMLRRFAEAFPNTAICDLAKEHIDAFLTTLGKTPSKSRNGRKAISAKSRNHHRAAIRQLLKWCVRRDYLSATHRLGEADAMRPEHANNGDVHLYTPEQFRALLRVAQGSMLAMIAIGGLAGLRTQELLRLDWADVWRVKKHIEVTAGKSKTRQRRLVPVGPALAAWLRPFRSLKTGNVCGLKEITWQQHFGKVCAAAAVVRKNNGLRHSFCSYHFALHANENLTAAHAGNSPSMIHGHYKGLVTKTEAKRWFSIKPKIEAKK